ncbi:hypothetical protein DICPUDRAFT_149194 [Dictyostelium purpureum]|uniref:PRA1 family protein n=1 Tax=Dictyostelium purpureum TaxID=5786 RepID=F0ZD26_DICPU|nr:uncharacterized protein DICPUDRAFT_149194 [Dictyostelium purpureum]EGC38194.1 hypothetical protein DICPUDRAFT_149194 [Dictyostelium purpureum]|eukprot:XP_003285321.1 hypothetical protein DICPUDRAFT_149194 [Dictyostelium purpureum]
MFSSNSNSNNKDSNNTESTKECDNKNFFSDLVVRPWEEFYSDQNGYKYPRDTNHQNERSKYNLKYYKGNYISLSFLYLICLGFYYIELFKLYIFAMVVGSYEFDYRVSKGDKPHISSGIFWLFGK